MKNYKLDTSLLPKVWVHWETKSGHYYLNCATGKKKATPELWMLMGYRYGRDISDGRVYEGINYSSSQNNKVWVQSGRSVKYAYAKYHADIDKLELAVVGVKTTKSEEPHPWEFMGDRFFIGKDKKIYDQRGNLITDNFYLYPRHTAYNGKDMLSMLLRANVNRKNFMSEFKKFIGKDYFTIGNGSTVQINNYWDIQRWYVTVQKARGKGKQQQLTDELTAIELTDTTGMAGRYPIKTITEHNLYRTWKTEIKNITYFERVNDQWCVLRTFYRTGGELNEAWRIYICEDGTTRIVSKGADGWIPSRQIRSYWNGYSYLANLEEAMTCNRIKYIINSTDKVGPTEAIDFLITALRFPEIEQLIKLGYSERAMRFIHTNTPKADLKEFFGGYYNEKEKSLLKKIGLTKPQFDIHMKDDTGYNKYSLKEMRNLFGDNLTSINIDTFKKYYEACEAITSAFYHRPILPYIEEMELDYLKFFKNIVRLADKNSNAYTIIKDTLQAWRGLIPGTRPAIDWYFDDFSDLVRAHDALTELKRIQDAERRAMWDMEAAERRKKEDEKRAKVDEERKQYEFDDGLYIIRLPKDSNEIIREGNVQRICIGGYTSRHALGHTNIFFLRKKSEEDMPFYAIEMDTNKHIVQIHGKCNQWLGNDPEAIPTVVRWIRKHDIKCEEKKLTCKAKGYSGCADCVPMPVVD